MLRMLTYPKHSVSSVCFNADGNKLVSGSHDETLKVWSVGSSGTFECESTLRVDAGDLDVQSVSFSPKGDVIAAGCSNGKIYLVDALAVEVKSTLAVDSGEYGVFSVSFSPKDNVIAAGCYNGKIHLVDAVAGEVKSTLTGHRYVPSL